MQTLTDKFVEGIYKIREEKLPSHSIEKAKYCLLDYLGVALAGERMLASKVKLLSELLHDNNTDGIVIGRGYNNNLQNAIFINGLNSHYLELDDGIRFGVIHPGAPLFSALIPLAVKYKISWERFVIGVMAGYEASIRIAASIQPSHYSLGYHPTSSCCPIGVALGITSMLGCNQKVMKDALSATSVSAGGTLKVLEDTSELKVFNVGKGAKLGYISAVMAQAGFSGPIEPLSGDTGFLTMMADSYDENMLLREDCEDLYINKVYLKPYASCRHTHAAIEAVLKLRTKYNLDINNITELNVAIYKGVIGKHDGKDIYGEASAKMSIPYCVAIALIIGHANMEAFEEPYVSDDSILKLTKLVKVIPDEYLSSLVPHKRVAKVTIKFSRGEEYTEIVEYPRGEPENPMSLDELYCKFKSLAILGGKTGEQVESIVDSIFAHNEVNMEKLFSLIK